MLVVGLSNPGPDFDGTRHNVGGDTVRVLSRRWGSGRLRPEKGQRAVLEEVRIGNARVALAVPNTYMNESGAAVRPLMRRFGIDDASSLVVLHDELDLPPGRIRVKLGGGLAGHKGLQSIRDHLHTVDFVRVRIGIGKPPGRQSGADHVLRRPGKAERELLEGAVETAADAVEIIVTEGVGVAMNRCNGECRGRPEEAEDGPRTRTTG
ncbi:MAG TPA: aminoacyl-tRNA hydrolase [Acidimicrobiales bacterium]|nr:aminoacyl-tRNA hydrolase [Acidimicrobiales bacterium]